MVPFHGVDNVPLFRFSLVQYRNKVVTLVENGTINGGGLCMWQPTLRCAVLYSLFQRGFPGTSGSVLPMAKEL